MAAEAQPELREMFNAARYRQFATATATIHPRFDAKRFVALATAGLEKLTLVQRVRRTSESFHETLPENFPEAVEILKRLAPRIERGFTSIFLPDFVGFYGHEHFAESMTALKFFTPFGSSEFAIRTFLKKDFERTLQVMTQWSLDSDEHVRRLASEGSRPRLPWSFQLKNLVHDPSPTRPILENLRTDSSLYVRKSVANHLNDISKDHPEIMLNWLNEWDLKNSNTAWIARHAARSLIKSGHPRSFGLFGFTAKPAVQLTNFKINPPQLKLGESLRITFQLKSLANKPQKLAVDYIIHYRKKAGHAAPKVFKLKEITIPANETLSFTKQQQITDFTTRVHYAGKHEVEVVVNGQILAKRSFLLSI